MKSLPHRFHDDLIDDKVVVAEDYDALGDGYNMMIVIMMVTFLGGGLCRLQWFLDSQSITAGDEVFPYKDLTFISLTLLLHFPKFTISKAPLALILRFALQPSFCISSRLNLF